MKKLIVALCAAVMAFGSYAAVYDTQTDDSVARLNDKFYTSLQEAINATKDNDTIVLLKKVETTAPLFVDTSITIDFDGHELINEPDTSNYWTFRFGDSKTGLKVTLKNGTVIGNEQNWKTGTKRSGFRINKTILTLDNLTATFHHYYGAQLTGGSDTKLILRNHSILSEKDCDSSDVGAYMHQNAAQEVYIDATSAIVSDSPGEGVIQGGGIVNVYGVVSNSNPSAKRAISGSGGQSPTIHVYEGGQVVAVGGSAIEIWGYGTIVVDGGAEVASPKTAIAAGSASAVTINGGKITSTEGTAITTSAANIVVNDGEISGKNGGISSTGGSVSVSGGEVKSETGAGISASGSTKGVTVSGGSIEGKTAGVSSSVGTIAVSGGEVKSENGAGVAVSGGTATVSGGTVEGKTGGVTTSGSATATVSGGEIKSETEGKAVSGNITVPEESTASFSDDSALEHTEVPSFSVTVGAPGEGVRIASIVRGETAFAEKDLKAGKFLVQEGQSLVVTYAAAKGYALVDKTAQLVWTLDQTTSASVAPKAVVQTVDCGAYVFDASPRAVLMTFVDGPTTRGFAWETDMTVSESKLWLLEGEHGEGDAALFLSDGRLVEGTCVARPEEPINVNCHKVKVYDLEPGTTYSYRLGGGDRFVYGTFSVPVVARSATFLNVNDAQVRAEDRLYVWENTMRRAAGVVPKPDVILSGGDVIDVNYFFKVEADGKGNDNFYIHPGYDNVSFGDTSSWFHFNYWRWGVDVDSAVPYFPGIPWSLASGNQDCEGVVRKGEGSYGAANGDIFYQQLTAVNWASDTLCCHSYDYANVHVVILPCLSRSDLTGSAYQQVADWTEQDLARAKAASKTEWTVVVMHFGPYTTGDHGLNAGKEGGIAQLFAPIFSKYHVDLVMQAHDHTFSKTLPYKWDAAGVYTSAELDPAVVNVAPATEVVDGETYDVNPKGTYYVCAGCAGHRVGEDGMKYAGTEGESSYTTRNYKVATGTIAVDSAWAKKGDNASQNPAASMFGVLRIEGNVLKYDFYAVATDGETEPVLYDTLRVKKAANFQITPYVQHPATNAMSVLWFTDQPGEATIKWWPAAGDPASAQTIDTVGTWAQALTNNLSQTGSNADVGTGDKFKHSARLTGLATGTRYTYAVELDSGVAYTNTFKTSPAADSSVRFIYYNDPETLPAYRDKKTTDWIDPKTGAGRTYYATKNQGYASNIVEMVKREPDLYVIAGDLAYQGGRQENWDSFWQHNAGGNGLGWNDPAGSTPILAAIGNHDLQDAVPKPAGMGENCENVLAGETALDRYLTYFEVEPNGVDFSHIDGRDRSQMFHRVDYGPVSLIFIDSNNGDDDDPQKDTNIYLYRDPTKPFPSKWGLGSGRSPDFNPGSEQYNWLTNNLADARRKSKFTFVVCHHCPYSVGYHCRTNVTESGEWLSSRALRCLDDVMLKYGVDGWLCGHDEMMEHSRLTGTEVLDDGTTREHSVEIYDMGTAGDGLRGGQITKEPNPIEVYRAHEDAPEVWKDGVLVDGGKHYGHMEINVAETEPGVWTAKLEPVYIFVNQDANGNAATFERRVYDDVKVLTNDLRVAPPVPWAGSGTEADPYQIGTADDLAALKTWVADGKETAGVCFLQTADIDFTGVSFDGIGSEANPFAGVYDGGSKTISNIVFPTAGTYKALFVRTRGVTIRNLNVSNVWFAAGLSGEYGCAALVGKELAGGVFENCAVSGTIGLEDRPLTHNGAGLVVSAAGTSVFRDCSFDGDVYVQGPDNDHVKSGAMTAICSTGSGATTTTFVGCTARGTLHNWTVYTEDKPEDLATAGAFSGYSNSGAKFVENCDVSELAFDVTEPGAVTSVAAGSFFGHYSSADFSVTNTLAPANMLPIGYEGANKSDLRYATLTAEGDALFDAGTLPFAAGKTYRLMAKGLAPAYCFAAPGTIAFDEALVPAANFDGITCDETLQLATNKVGAVTTFTASVIPEEPEEPEDPEEPEEPETVDVTINEIMASNGSSLKTASGVKGIDWVELYNAGEKDVDLAGWYFGNDPTKKVEKWADWVIQGSCVVPAKGYKVLWCDGDGICSNWADTEAYVACNISTTAGKHTLFLSPTNDPSGIVCQVTVPAMMKDVSYGAAGEGCAYFREPTPGRANPAQGYGPVTPQVSFSEQHGYKTAPFELTLTCEEDPEAQIYYTLDGSSPTTASTPYTGPIAVSRTTCIRAAVVRENSVLQMDSSATYLYVDDILQQSTTVDPEGFPATFIGMPAAGSAPRFRYGLHSDIVNGKDRERLINGFTNRIATMSMVIDLKNLFDTQTGIYRNATKDGKDWERQTMLEQFSPVGDKKEMKGFSVSAGVRIRGGSSRTAYYAKHAFRFFFRSEYGMGSLDYPLFGDEGADSFEKVDLRCSQNYSWANSTDYSEQYKYETFIHECFSRDSQGAMGEAYTRSRYYHLFINGQYWGLYMTQERGSEEFAETYVGGAADNYDVIKTSVDANTSYSVEADAGTWDAWDGLMALAKQGFGGDHADNYYKAMGRNPDGTRNSDYPVYLNPTNLMVFMLSTHYACDADSPNSVLSGSTHPNNLYALRDRVDTGDPRHDGFFYLRHDAEHTLGIAPKEATTQGNYHLKYLYDSDPTLYGVNVDLDRQHFNPAELHYRLCQNPEYKRAFADLFYRHCLKEGGAMTAPVAEARFRSRMAEIDDAIVGESARWGWQVRDGSCPRLTNYCNRDNWLNVCNNNVIDGFIKRRMPKMLEQYRNRGWYPSIDVARAQDGQGASVADGTTIKANDRLHLVGDAQCTVFYTTDGSDPCQANGEPAAGAAACPEDGLAVPPEGLRITMRARSSSGEWSALDTVRVAGERDLARPADALRVAAVMSSAAKGESDFLVLTNLAAKPVVLGGVKIVAWNAKKDSEDAPSLTYLLADDCEIAAGGSLTVSEGEFPDGGKLTNSRVGLKVYDTNGDEPVCVQEAFVDADWWQGRCDGTGAYFIAREFGALVTDESQWWPSDEPTTSRRMTVTAPLTGTVVKEVTIGGIAVAEPQAGVYLVPAGQSLVVTYAPMEGYEFAYDVVFPGEEIDVQTLTTDGAKSLTLAARKINEEFVIGNDPEKVKAAEAKIAEDVAAFADPQIAVNVKTTEDYLMLRTWAASVGGEAAVAAAPNAFQSYELRDVVATPKLFDSAPVFEIAAAGKDGVSGLVFGIRLKDGASKVDVVKTIANAIEVSVDLDDWGRISPDAVSIEDGIALVVLPQTEEKGFMRVRLAQSTYYPITVDKTWCSVGTSISWYGAWQGPQHTTRFNDGYQTRVLRSIQFKAHYYAGCNGGCVSDSVSALGKPGNPANNVNEANTAAGAHPCVADIYTIEHGVNDWGHGVAVGTINDYKNNTKNGTFAANYRKLIDGLRKLNANAKFVLCTPRRGIGFYQGTSSGYYMPMSSDEPSLQGNHTYLKDYVDVVRAIAAYEGFPVADFYANCGTDEELPSLSIDCALHPNDAGHERLAQELIPALLKVLGE